jgi:disulfide oxidoreductase YuzD
MSRIMSPPSTPICANCVYAPRDKDEYSWEWRCKALESKLNYITGTKLTIEKKCIDKNKEGQCQDYRNKLRLHPKSLI